MMQRAHSAGQRAHLFGGGRGSLRSTFQTSDSHNTYFQITNRVTRTVAWSKARNLHSVIKRPLASKKGIGRTTRAQL